MTGFVLVDKPPGPTSHDVVDAVRRALGTRKVGHAGTLDPPASGLVVVGVGAATRLLRFAQGLPKVYETDGLLGAETTTLDAAGEVVSTAEVDVSRADLEAVLDAFVGDIDQVPPAVSAVKVAGERAYRRAARGEQVELSARRVTVHDLELLDFASPSFTLRVRCSAGTYIRSLVADVGSRLGCGAHVTRLRRTAIGSLRVDEGVAPEEVSPDVVLPIEQALRDMRRVAVSEEAARRARHGQRIEHDGPEGEVLVCGPDGPVGVFRSQDGILRPMTVLAEAR